MCESSLPEHFVSSADLEQLGRTLAKVRAEVDQLTGIPSIVFKQAIPIHTGKYGPDLMLAPESLPHMYRGRYPTLVYPPKSQGISIMAADRPKQWPKLVLNLIEENELFLARDLLARQWNVSLEQAGAAIALYQSEGPKSPFLGKDGKTISPWRPTTNQVELKTVLKLIEELGEAVSAAARTLMQGVDGTNPEDGKSNRQWLQEELADVHAGTVLTAKFYGLSREEINTRSNMKQERLILWHAMAGEDNPNV